MEPYTLCTLTVSQGVHAPRFQQVANWADRTVTFLQTRNGYFAARPIKHSPAIVFSANSPVTELLPPGGVVQPGTQVVAITRPTAVRVCYTIDGTEPACSASLTCSTGFDQAVTPIPVVSANITIKALGCAHFYDYYPAQYPGDVTFESNLVSADFVVRALVASAVVFHLSLIHI